MFVEVLWAQRSHEKPDLQLDQSGELGYSGSAELSTLMFETITTSIQVVSELNEWLN